MSRVLLFRYPTRATLTLGLACAVVAAIIAGFGEPATAATFTVTKTADTADGACDADCSLREAVIAANAAPGLDTISLPSGTFSLTIVGGGEDSAATGDLDVTDNLTINGAGFANTAIEVGAGDDRVFDVINTLPIITLLTVTDLEIRNGKGDVGFGCECGGGILVRTDAWLRLVNTTVIGNSATGGSLSTGGGIDNGGTLTIENSFILGNSADFAGGINNGPGASLTMTGGNIEANTASSSVGGVELPPGSAATIIGVLIDRNTAGGGAGGFDVSGSLELINSSVLENTAGGNGGGLEVSGGTVTAVDSSIVNNTATGDGGGIFSNGDITLTNSTISGNSAGGSGGGILNNVVANLTSTNSTIAGNTPNGIHNYGTATLKNTIIANNSGANCVVPTPITSLGHNLDSGSTCGLSGPGDLANSDPRLGPLEATTGPSHWHPLLAGSPAIDAGDNAGCPGTDQRGSTRPLDGNGDGTPVCDIGAYEFAPTPIPCPADAPCETVAPASPTGTAAPTLPTTLPGTGGDRGSGNAVPLALAAVAAIAAAGIVWRTRRGRR
jgi:CSLREA domain-containing protein